MRALTSEHLYCQGGSELHQAHRPMHRSQTYRLADKACENDDSAAQRNKAVFLFATSGHCYRRLSFWAEYIVRKEVLVVHRASLLNA